MNYVSEGHDSWRAWSAVDMQLGTPTSAVRMKPGGEAELQHIQWEHPAAFNEAEIRFPTIVSTDQLRLSREAAESNPRFCRGSNAPTTVFIDLFNSAASSWMNIYNRTLYEHCEYIHGTILRFSPISVSGVRFSSYPPGDPTYLEWSSLKMTFRTISDAKLELNSQASIDVRAGTSASIESKEVAVGSQCFVPALTKP